MVHGEPEIDLQSSDIARFYPEQRTPAHIKGRTSEGFNKTYGIVHPASSGSRTAACACRRSTSARRISAPSSTRRRRGSGRTGTSRTPPLVEEYGVQGREHEWDARWWSPIINAEHLAMRERAAMFDLTAFCVFDVVGPNALDAVQMVAARQMNVPNGRVVYTPVLAPRGGFKSDLTIMKMDDDRFRVVTGGAHGMADMKWFRDHCPAGTRIEDHTSTVCTVGLWGPRARDILASITGTDVSNEAFPFSTWQELDNGVIASRISYVGDLGWELYMPMEHGLELWDALWEAGRPHGVVPAGIGVYGTTGRLEKAYRAFGAELDQDYDVVEADMAWWKVKDEDFVGKAAHVARARARAGGDAVHAHDRRAVAHARSAASRSCARTARRSSTRRAAARTSPPRAWGRRSASTSSCRTSRRGDRRRSSTSSTWSELYPVTVDVVGSRAPFDPDNERIRS